MAHQDTQRNAPSTPPKAHASNAPGAEFPNNGAPNNAQPPPKFLDYYLERGSQNYDDLEEHFRKPAEPFKSNSEPRTIEQVTVPPVLRRHYILGVAEDYYKEYRPLGLHKLRLVDILTVFLFIPAVVCYPFLAGVSFHYFGKRILLKTSLGSTNH